MSTGAASQTIVGRLAVELGMSDEQFRAALNRASSEAEKAAAKIQSKVSQASNQVAKAANNGAAKNAMGLLNLSRAIDDVQYGFSGIVNNIEGIVTGFGFGAGIAGAATIAAVAINSLTPAIEGVYRSSQKMFEGFQDGAEQARMSVSGMMGGGFGSQGLASAFREQAEFLMGRSDRTDFDLTRRFGDRSAVTLSQRRYEAALAENMRRAVEAAALMQQAFRAASDASHNLAKAQRGATAQYDLTTDQQAAQKLNQELFQEAVDSFRGGDNLRTKIVQAAMRDGMIRSEGERLYGGFARGDIPETRRVEQLLNLGTERGRVMDRDFERMTGAAEELRRIEEQAAKTKAENAKFIEQEQRWLERSIELDQQRERIRQNRIMDRQFDEYERSVSQYDSLVARRDSIMSNLNRSEILGSAADVFARNVNAGQKSDELKQLEEINEGIKNLKPMIGLS